MSSPSRPVNIGSPRQGNVFHSGSLTPTGTPDLRAWRAQYTGTPPVPNIPARFAPGSVSSGSPGANLLPQAELTGRANYLSPAGRISPARPSSSGTPGTPASGVDPGAVDLDNLPDEDKAKVIRRHLLMPEERQNRGDVNSISGSYRDARVFNEDVPSAGSSTPARPPREETETFPIPYEAPGADITSVQICHMLMFLPKLT
jgi:proton-coupled amino acid transporter